MTKRDWLASPWPIVALAAWLVLMVIGTQLAIPIFANVASPGLQCDPACPTETTTEWLPSLLTAAAVATIVVGALFGSAWWLRRHLR